jgi:hypothetical protein
MKEWTSTYMTFHLNFTNPMKISVGKEKDLLVLRVKSLNFFRSESSGDTLKSENRQFSMNLPK